MKLEISFVKNLSTEDLLALRFIPCFCKVAKEFEISFSNPLPEASGIVSDWDRVELEKRSVAGGGGRYTHYGFGRVTLKEVKDDVYEIVDLEMFNEVFGWCSVIADGQYAVPGVFWDQE